jgi:hypothetical protein
VAKSSRRKKQDRAKAEARRAEQSRLRAKAEHGRQLVEHYSRLLDPRTGPADVAELLAADMPDTLTAGAVVKMRLSFGVPAGDIGETARLLLAAAPEPRGIGVLTVAAWAAHLAGDEDGEHRYARELLDRADAGGDAGMRLEVIRGISVRGHPGEACELIEPYLREHPDDGLAAEAHAGALALAHGQAEPGERDRAALARYADRSGIDALSEELGAFLARTDWGETVRKRVAADRARLEKEHWGPAEHRVFEVLAVELAVKFPDTSGEDSDPARADGPADTALRAFAADPEVPRDVAARASEWDDHVHYGVWQLPDPLGAPGAWCTDLVSGARRYAQFPAPPGGTASAGETASAGGTAPWSVWLGALVPVDGIWRGTGAGIWLSPVEGDALAEYVDQAAKYALMAMADMPREELPEPGYVRFGQAEPYCVRWEAGEEAEPEFADFASMATASLITTLVSQVWLKRANAIKLTNTDGDPMLIIDAMVAVSGDVTRPLLAHPDFAEDDEDGQFVWWGSRVDEFDGLLGPDDEAERWVLGHVTPGDGQIRIRVNSQRRLDRLMLILDALGVKPRVTEEKRVEPSLDFAWGPVPDDSAEGGARSRRDWEKSWLDQAVAALNFRTPRQAAAGDAVDFFRVEALLRQLEYQSALAAARGEQGIDVAWMRAELGLADEED